MHYHAFSSEEQGLKCALSFIPMSVDAPQLTIALRFTSNRGVSLFPEVDSLFSLFYSHGARALLIVDYPRLLYLFFSYRFIFLTV